MRYVFRQRIKWSINFNDKPIEIYENRLKVKVAPRVSIKLDGKMESPYDMEFVKESK